MNTLDVNLGPRRYPIHIGHGLLGQTELLAPHIANEAVMLVSNETVAPLYLPLVEAALAGFHVEQIILPDGEQFKTLATLEIVITALLESKFGRDCTLIALGGGVVGDITGFAAACYQRGVPFIQLPTTLLAQVDSSVGGKTGVNHALGKNMVGAFHQPQCVVADTNTLGSLPDRELRAGVAEVIKYGLIRDAEFFSWLEENMGRLLTRDPEALAYAISRSCANKAAVVQDDEREAGSRALLNLGHTFGHAIEAGLGYGRWLHGEAVAAGMCVAAAMSHRMGSLSAGDLARARRLVADAGLPTELPDSLSVADYMELMSVDKKVRAGKLRLVLLENIGAAFLSDDFDLPALEACLATSSSAA